MIVATYARVSTQQQAESGTSLEDQRATLEQFCQRNALTILEHIADEGITGAAARRPGLDRVRQLAREQRIQAVVVC